MRCQRARAPAVSAEAAAVRKGTVGVMAVWLTASGADDLPGDAPATDGSSCSSGRLGAVVREGWGGGALRAAPRASNASGLALHREHRDRSSKLGREGRATCDGAWAAWAQAGVARSHVPNGCCRRWSPSPRWAAEPSRLPEGQPGWAKPQATRWPPQVRASRCIRLLPSARGTNHSSLACGALGDRAA
jgi:hypothetical protein